MNLKIEVEREENSRWIAEVMALPGCPVAYDCRIGCARQKYPKTGAETLFLINIGTHKEVY